MRLVAIPLEADADAIAVELVSDRCWAAGAAGIWEHHSDGRLELRVAVPAGSEAAFLVAVAELGPVDVTDATTVELAAKTVVIEAGGARFEQVVPATVFGAGDHPTTRHCLEAVAALAGPDVELLDVGCGTGVLSVAAALLGSRVTAIDVDPEAVAATTANAEANGVVVEASTEPLAAVGSAYDVVVANLSAATITAMAGDLARVARRGGHLVLSGMLDEQWLAVAAGFPGWTPETRTSDGGWTTAVLRRP